MIKKRDTNLGGMEWEGLVACENTTLAHHLPSMALQATILGPNPACVAGFSRQALEAGLKTENPVQELLAVGEQQLHLRLQRRRSDWKDTLDGVRTELERLGPLGLAAGVVSQSAGASAPSSGSTSSEGGCSEGGVAKDIFSKARFLRVFPASPNWCKTDLAGWELPAQIKPDDARCVPLRRYYQIF